MSQPSPEGHTAGVPAAFSIVHLMHNGVFFVFFQRSVHLKHILKSVFFHFLLVVPLIVRWVLSAAEAPLTGTRYCGRTLPVSTQMEDRSSSRFSFATQPAYAYA